MCTQDTIGHQVWCRRSPVLAFAAYLYNLLKKSKNKPIQIHFLVLCLCKVTFYFLKLNAFYIKTHHGLALLSKVFCYSHAEFDVIFDVITQLCHYCLFFDPPTHPWFSSLYIWMNYFCVVGQVSSRKSVYCISTHR